MFASFAFIKRANDRARLLRDQRVYDLSDRRRATTRFQDSRFIQPNNSFAIQYSNLNQILCEMSKEYFSNKRFVTL